MTGWDDKSNADKYDQYAKRFSTYRDTSRDLVHFAGIGSGMDVIDLACGTGVTSQAILELLEETGWLYAIDMSQAMLDKARQNLKSHNISFHLSKAEDVHTVIEKPIDRVVCNSAFWQMQQDQTLQAIRSVLDKGGLLAYNLPRPFFTVSTIESDAGQSGNFHEQMREIAINDFGIDISSITSSRKRYTPPTLDQIRRSLHSNGFTLVTHKIITYTQSFEGSSKFCTIPVMTERILPGVDYPTRMAVLEKAREGLNPEAKLKMPWLFIAAKITV